MAFFRVICAFLALLLTPQTYADSQWEWAPDQAIGESLPLFSADSHRGERVAISELGGPNGTLLFFNRSTEW